MEREVCGKYLTRTGKEGATVRRSTDRDGRVTYSFIGAWGAGSGLSVTDMRREVDYWNERKRGMQIVIPFVE